MIVTIGVLAPAIKIAGIAIASEFVGRLMEDHGHGNKVIFVRVITYVACGMIAMEYWWQGVKYIASTFGVRI
jgi:hypothetical protein